MRNDLYLIDSSVWLEVLPPSRDQAALRQRVKALLEADRVATTGVVLLELLSGTRTETEYRRLGQMLSALHRLPVPEERWIDAASLGFRLRRQGVAVPFSDLLLAAVAIHEGAVLVHRDRHFDLVAAHAPLTVESHLPAAV